MKETFLPTQAPVPTRGYKKQCYIPLNYSIKSMHAAIPGAILSPTRSERLLEAVWQRILSPRRCRRCRWRSWRRIVRNRGIPGHAVHSQHRKQHYHLVLVYGWPP